MAVAGHLVRWVLLALGRTWKLEVVEGREHLEGFLAAPRPALLSFWHNRSLPAAYFLYRNLVRAGIAITLFASHSRDGELTVRAFRPWGVHIVRGSASRGGRVAIRALHRAITRRASSPIMIPDGPRGPLYRWKLGVAVLAQVSKAPILPVGFAAQRFWALKSWDRQIVPMPFSRVAVVVGEPQEIAPGLSQDELQGERMRLEGLLIELTERAEAAVGASDPAR